MKFSTKTRYAIRSILDIAINSEKEEVLMKDISKRQQISYKYLDRILGDLKRSGIIKKQKAKIGGYVLAKLPEDIKLADIVRTMEGGILSLECPVCKRQLSCATSRIWKKVEDAMEKVLEISIKDLMSDQEDLDSKNPFVYHI